MCSSAESGAERARTDHFAFTIARYELAGLADRVWDLRNNQHGRASR